MERIVSRARRAIDCALRPASVVVVGVSDAPGSAGRNAIRNLIAGGYQGAVHIVSRGGVRAEGIEPVRAIEDLPAGIDLAILALPASAMLEAIRSCAAREIGVAVIFASGFAELGAEGRATQDAIVQAASAGNMALIGPNCLGYSSRVGGLSVGFGVGSIAAAQRSDDCVAVLTQSGGMMAHASLSLGARNIPISHAVSTGNEAMLGIEDFLADFARDEPTRSVIVYAEQIRQPAAFLAGVRACRERGKTVVLLHPGRSERAQAAALSHSGAMAGDHAAMRVLVAHAGAVFVETLEELVDVAELLARADAPPTRGVGVLTTSGAFCGIALDYCDRIGLDVPTLEAPTLATMRAALPPFAQPANPLDLTTQPQREPELLGKGLQALLDDPGIGSVVIAITPGGPAQSVKYFDGLQPALGGATKPLALAIMGDGSALTDEFLARVRDSRVSFSRSPERALRTMAAITEHGRATSRAMRAQPQASAAGPDAPPAVPISEYRAKQYLARLGLGRLQGDLARDASQAVRLAEALGYPVVLKAQSAQLLHKTDAGGLALDLRDEPAIRSAWRTVTDAVSAARPGMALDGMLVEPMARPGLDLIVAARRVGGWGVVVMAGLGGIWTEALQDFRLMPAGLAEDDIVAELRRLRGAALLTGGRGSPPLDLAAVARTIGRIGRALLDDPAVAEIEINPLRVYTEGEGVAPLDALMHVAPDWTA